MSENGSYRSGPSQEEYRKRRIIAGVIAALVLLLLIWGMVSLVRAISGSSSSNAGAAASPTATSVPFSDFSARPTASSTAIATANSSASSTATEKATASASDSASATASASAQATVTAEPTASASASATVAPTPSASATTESAVTACSANNLKVSLTTDQQVYTAGTNPTLTINYTNTSGSPCDISGDIQSLDINIISGPAQVFNSSQCQTIPQGKIEVAAGQSGSTSMVWNRQLNVLGCNTTAKIQPGYYWATATVDGVVSAPTRIIVQG